MAPMALHRRSAGPAGQVTEDASIANQTSASACPSMQLRASAALFWCGMYGVL